MATPVAQNPRDPRRYAPFFPRSGVGIKVADLEVVPAYDPGRRAINVLRVAANVADTETVTIGADVYEFDRAANGVATGRIAVTGHADDTPANATDALITAINTKGTEAVSAVDISANEILLVANAVGAVAIACTETLAGANNVWANATMYGGRAAGARKLVTQTRVPKTEEVNLGNLHFFFDFAPTIIAAMVFVTATPGLIKDWNGAATVTGNRVTLDNTGLTDWAATDTVVLIVSD